MADREPLVTTVRAFRRMKSPTFEVAPYSFNRNTPPGLKLMVAFGGAKLSEPPLTSVPLTQFMRVPVGAVEGSLVTVAEAIDHSAHVEGGVHFGLPSSKTERALADIAPAFVQMNRAGYVSVLGDIGRIVVAGLRPLVDELRARPTPPVRLVYSGEETAAIDE